MDVFTGYRVDAVIAALLRSSITNAAIAIDWQDVPAARSAGG